MVGKPGFGSFIWMVWFAELFIAVASLRNVRQNCHDRMRTHTHMLWQSKIYFKILAGSKEYVEWNPALFFFFHFSSLLFIQGREYRVEFYPVKNSTTAKI